VCECVCVRVRVCMCVFVSSRVFNWKWVTLLNWSGLRRTCTKNVRSTD